MYRCAQLLSAFAGGTSAYFQAELTGFESQLAIVVEEGHHLWGQGKFQGAVFTGFECDSLEANEMMERDNGRGVEIGQVKLGNFSCVRNAALGQRQVADERSTAA